MLRTCQVLPAEVRTALHGSDAHQLAEEAVVSNTRCRPLPFCNKSTQVWDWIRTTLLRCCGCGACTTRQVAGCSWSRGWCQRRPCWRSLGCEPTCDSRCCRMVAQCRVWSELFNFQLRYQQWQASHEALLSGTVSAAAPEVAAFQDATAEALAAGLRLLREGRLTALQPIGEVRRKVTLSAPAFGALCREDHPAWTGGSGFTPAAAALRLTGLTPCRRRHSDLCTSQTIS